LHSDVCYTNGSVESILYESEISTVEDDYLKLTRSR